MNNFIEIVCDKGEKHLVNMSWIEEIIGDDGGCTIYFAFSYPGALEQDHIVTWESYESIVERIREADND